VPNEHRVSHETDTEDQWLHREKPYPKETIEGRVNETNDRRRKGQKGGEDGKHEPQQRCASQDNETNESRTNSGEYP
jgi:hypothetical protein